MREIRRNGVFETGTLSWHLGHDAAGDPTFHVHGLLVASDGVFGGHLFGGTVLLTLELTLLLPAVTWHMGPHDPEPHVPMAIPRKAFLPFPACPSDAP